MSGMFMYADYLFLSVHSLEIMVNVCETELSWLDVRIYVNKSICMRFGSILSCSMLI